MTHGNVLQIVVMFSGESVIEMYLFNYKKNMT